MKHHPRCDILFLFLQLTLLATSTVTAASCDEIACPAVVIPLPKECKIRETHEIPEDICTCVWDQCSCGYSCRFPQCSHTNTTVTCLVEPCATKDCQYGCTNDYCTGCNGYCWEKPYNPTDPTTTASPTDPTSPPNPPCARMCPAVVVPLPDGCEIRNVNATSECLCEWDQCSCGWQCSTPTMTPCPNPVQCLIDPCSTKTCDQGTTCQSNYCGACTATCVPVTTKPPCNGICPAVIVPLPDGCQVRNVNATSECLCDWDQCSCGWQCSIPAATPCLNPVQCLIDPCSTTKCDEGTRCQSNYCGACTATCVPEADCPNPVQCLVDPCSTTTCEAGTTCKSSYCGGCTATCIPNASNPTGSTPDCPNPVQCLIHPCATMLCAAGTVCEANYCYGCNATCKPITTEKPIHYSNDTSSSCLYNGHIYLHGQMIQVECNTCICTNGSMICTGKACISSSTSGIRNDTCIYNGQTYTHGQSTQSTDGCNTCTCTNQGMACTLMACSSTGINNNITCTAFGRTYTPGQKMLSLDGCNTCQCGSDGQIECTLIACLNNTATYIGVTPTILFATTVTLAMIV